MTVDSFLSYRDMHVGGPVPYRLIGPGGVQHQKLSQGISFAIGPAAAPKRARRILTGMNRILSDAEEVRPEAAVRMMSGVEGWRGVIDDALVRNQVTSRPTRDADLSRWLFIPNSVHSRVTEALNAAGQVAEALVRSNCFGGQNPMKIADSMRQFRGRAASQYAIGGGAAYSDTFNIYRVPVFVGEAPRISDPRFFDRLVLGFAAVGMPEALVRSFTLQWRAGMRPSEPLLWTAYDLNVRSRNKPRGTLLAHNLKSLRRPTRDVSVGVVEHGLLERYWDNERHKLTGCSLADVRELASDPSSRDQLRRMPVFTLDGHSHITYDQARYRFRLAAIHQDVFIEDDRYFQDGIKRFVSPHWLRHEFVHMWMERALLLPTLADRKAEERHIAAYMAWGNGEGMLEWYAAHHRHRRGLWAAAALNSSVDRAYDAGAEIDAPVFHDGADLSAADWAALA